MESYLGKKVKDLVNEAALNSNLIENYQCIKRLIYGLPNIKQKTSNLSVIESDISYEINQIQRINGLIDSTDLSMDIRSLVNNQLTRLNNISKRIYH